MGLGLDDLVEDFGVPALVVGVGAALLAPVLLPIGKPLAKSAIKAGLALYEKSKGAFAEMGEAFEDLVAESKAELAEAQSQKHLPGTAIVPAESRAITQ
jgi:hypothetical protein